MLKGLTIGERLLNSKEIVKQFAAANRLLKQWHSVTQCVFICHASVSSRRNEVLRKHLMLSFPILPKLFYGFMCLEWSKNPIFE